MANFRSSLYTAARLSGDIQQFGRVKQVGGKKIKKIANTKTFYGVTKITVGYFGNTRYPNQGRPWGNNPFVKYIALLNEFGGRASNGTSVIPERPFMRRATNNVRTTGATGPVLQSEVDVTRQKLTTPTSAKRAAQILVDAIQYQIDTSQSWAEPNSPYTIALKGSDQPLLDTALMRNSVETKSEFGRIPNPQYLGPAPRPFNWRNLAYDTAKFIGDVQAIASGNVAQRAGNRLYGKFSGRALGAVTPQTRGPSGRAQRKVAGKVLGRLR